MDSLSELFSEKLKKDHMKKTFQKEKKVSPIIFDM